MADKTQTFIVILLVFAILSSAVSMYISWTSLKIELPYSSSGKSGGQAGSPLGNVGLFVEAPEIVAGSSAATSSVVEQNEQ